MEQSLSKQERFAALLGAVWFVISARTLFQWLLGLGRGLSFSLLIVIIGTIILIGNGNTIRLDYRDKKFYISIVVLLLYLILFKNAFVGPLAICGPWLFLLLWPKHIKEKIYEYIRNFFIFYAIGSTFITILAFIGLLDRIPYFIIEDQSGVQEAHGIINRVYGIFVVPVSVLGLSLRACGPFTEGGHFAVYLGLIYFIELMCYSKRRISLIVGGLFTLSPVFLVFALIAEFTKLHQIGKVSNLFKTFFAAVILSFIVYAVLPESIKDIVYQTVVERSLDRVLGQVQAGDLMAALDERANAEGEMLYARFINQGDLGTFLLGSDKEEFGDSILSDYRAILIQKGLIGLILYLLLLCFSSFRTSSNLKNFMIFLLGGIVFLHRAWMIPHLDQFFLLLFASSSVSYNYENDKKIQLCL